MYALKISNSSPAIYIGVNDGFIDKTDTITGAFQMARMQDAQAFQAIVVDATEIVSV